MKPSALVASLLLHALGISAFLYFGMAQRVSEPSTTPLSVVLVSMPSVALHASAAPADRPQQTKRRISDSPTPRVVASATRPVSTDSASTEAPAALISASTQVSTGDAVKTGVSIPAHYAASNRKPRYPSLSIRMEEEGTVLLRALIRADGRASKVQIGKSSGHPLLDESALNAVRDWHFSPASVNNHPVDEWYQLPVTFRLPA